MMKHSILAYIRLVILLNITLVPAGTLAADLETLTNREGSVTVKVTPLNILPGVRIWDFEVTLSTHTGMLDQDMKHVAVLAAGSGNPLQPLVWVGDPPGGHHRKGILRFQSPQLFPQFIELNINGIGGVNRRVFRWKLKP